MPPSFVLSMSMLKVTLSMLFSSGNSLFRASDPSNLFSLGESVYRSDGLVTAVVKSRAPIDREEIGSNYEITVQVHKYE